MASIEALIKLNDQMSATLKRVDKNVDKLISNFTKLENTVNKSFNNSNAAQQRFNNSMSQGVGLANRLGNALKVALASYMSIQGISKTIGLADNLQMTTNRLDLLTGGEGTDELKRKIYESAMRSRADYLGTADSIAKMGLRTGKTFNSMDELIAFNETLNKMYAIAGTGAHEQFGATLQLIQALGSGVLRGQEFNAVFEAAPNVLQAVAKHMDVPVEKLREMAEEGAITSTILKNAMFEAAKDTNEQFKKLKYTFGHVFTGLKNSAINSFQPVLQQISNITSSKRWISFIDGIGIAIDNLARFSSKAFGILSKVVGFCYDLAVVIKNNWDFISPIIWGVVAAMTALKVQTKLATAASIAHGVASAWETFCITALYVKSHGLIAALKVLATHQGLCATTALAWAWVIILIVAVFYLVIAAVNKFTKVSVSATGLIFGAFAWLGAAIGNVFIVLYNTFIDIINSIVNGCIKAAEIIYNAFNGGFTGWINGVQAKLWEFVNGALQLIKPLISAWDKIKGTNYSTELQMKVDERIFDNKVGSKSTYKKFDGYDSFKKEHSLDFIDTNKAWEKGYDLGAKLSGSLTLDKLGKTDSISDLINAESDVGKYLKGDFANNPALDDILNNTKDIANNTAVDTDKEDLSYMRDMAARDAINRHTTRNVKIEMVNNNNVSGDMDLNTILQQIAKTVNDAVNVNASGIHY